MPDLLALSADFALDVRLAMPEVTAGSVMRATNVSRLARSSSIDTARILQQLGRDVEIGGFLAGTNGKFIQQQLEVEGLRGHYARCDGETPQHFSVTEQDNRRTSLNEQGVQIESTHLRQLAAEIEKMKGQFAWVGFSGDGFPSMHIPAKAYEVVYEAALPAKLAVSVIGDALRMLARWNPDLLCISGSEASYVLGKSAVSIQDARNACEGIRYWGGDMVIVNLDAQGVVGCDDGGYWHAILPTVTNFSSNGLLAGALDSLLEGASFDEVLRKAVSASIPDRDLASQVVLTKLE